MQLEISQARDLIPERSYQMKNLFNLPVLAGLVALPALAWSSELSLSMANNQKFLLAFDNSMYSTPSNTYNVTNILPGQHHVRMTSAPSQMSGACGMPQLLYDGWITIPQNARVTAYPVSLSQLNVVSVLPEVQQGYYNSYDPY